jgi:hypothetical protein
MKSFIYFFVLLLVAIVRAAPSTQDIPAIKTDTAAANGTDTASVAATAPDPPTKAVTMHNCYFGDKFWRSELKKLIKLFAINTKSSWWEKGDCFINEGHRSMMTTTEDHEGVALWGWTNQPGGGSASCRAMKKGLQKVLDRCDTSGGEYYLPTKDGWQIKLYFQRYDY